MSTDDLQRYLAMPHDDLIAHDLDNCTCGPLHIPVVTGQGERTRIEIHRRLDGLENEPFGRFLPRPD